MRKWIHAESRGYTMKILDSFTSKFENNSLEIMGRVLSSKNMLLALYVRDKI